jgi:hypothetical protein
VLIVAPDIGELKLFATALKMGSAFSSIDKLAQKWIEQDYQGRAWRDLNPRELEEDEKREWYDLHDSWERANKELRGKLLRFEQDPYSNGASPILRYERIVESMGVRGKLFLGLNSRQAKGYRIIELDYPRWLEQLMQTDSGVFRSENLSEGEVYALVPERGLSREQEDVLFDEYKKDLQEAGIPAWETTHLVGGESVLKAEFLSRYNKVIDKRFAYDMNVLREQALVKQIKREHALAVPGPREVAVGPPVSPVRIAVAVPVQPSPKGKSLTEEDVLFDMPYRDQEPESLDHIISRLSKDGFEVDMRKLQQILSDLLKKGEVFEHRPGFYAWTETEAEVAGKEEEKVEEKELKELEIPEEPEQTVYVKVHVEGGVPSDEQGKPKLQAPEFVLMGTTYEEFAKHSRLRANPWEEGSEMWTRPIVGMMGCQMLVETLKEGEIDYDAVEDLQMSYGQEWDAIRESLADNPPPFNKFARFHIKWRPEDVFWEESAKQAYDIYNFHYTRDDLLRESKRSLQVIAKIKGIETGGDEGALIDRIVAFVPGTEEIEEPKLVEQKPSWKKGMPLTDDQIEQAKYDAIMHIAEDDIPRTVMMYYNQQGKDAALRVLKEKIMNWGQGGPDEPDVHGTSKGVEVSNEIMNPTDVKIISYPDLLDYILRWNEMKAQAYNKPQPAPAAKPTPTVPVEKAPVTQPTKTTQPTPTTPTPPTPRPTKILSSEDMRLLQDYWNTQFIRAIGKVPAGFSSVFRIEFQEVKMLPFVEAKAAILAAADREIAGIESAQRVRTVIREGERISPGAPRAPGKKGVPMGVPVGEGEEEEFRLPVAVGRVPPSAFPSMPLSVGQPFPRGPTSLEQLRLWNVFCYSMQQEGYDCTAYAREFTEYISKSQFLSWQDLHQRFDFFVNTIMKGATLPPLVQWRAKLTTPTGLRGELQELEPSPEPAKLTAQQIEDEERNAVKRQRILISHWAAALIHQARYYNKVKTMTDLYNEVVNRGVIDASIPETIFIPIAKEAIREIYSQPLRPVEHVKTDDEEEEVEKLNLAKVPYVDISQQEIDEFLATS